MYLHADKHDRLNEIVLKEAKRRERQRNTKKQRQNQLLQKIAADPRIRGNG